MAGLLNIGEMGALALHVLLNLAELQGNDPEGRRTVQELAESLHASVHTLQKVTRRLVMLGMIESTRGVNGGIRLVANPGKTTMLQVIEGIEGQLSSNGCMFAKRVCPAGAPCIFEDITGGMEKMVRDYFSRTTLAELCASATGQAG